MSSQELFVLSIMMPSGDIEFSMKNGLTTPDSARATWLTREELDRELTLVELARKSMHEGSLKTWIEKVDLNDIP